MRGQKTVKVPVPLSFCHLVFVELKILLRTCSHDMGACMGNKLLEKRLMNVKKKEEI